jgi:serine/threonine protein phosphatase PrpC
MYRAPSGAERLVEFGTTCTAAVLQQGRLVIGNAGDSCAVLGRCLTAPRAATASSACSRVT